MKWIYIAIAWYAVGFIGSWFNMRRICKESNMSFGEWWQITLISILACAGPISPIAGWIAKHFEP